jgi:hypothetical protein
MAKLSGGAADDDDGDRGVGALAVDPIRGRKMTAAMAVDAIQGREKGNKKELIN